jgi:hypothetical protein
MRAHLEAKAPRYARLLALHGDDQHNWSLIHELLFAYLLDKAGIELEYEHRLDAANPKTVDFFVVVGGVATAFELVRIHFTPTLREKMSAIGRKFFGAMIMSNNADAGADTAGQLIRLQEKLCAKADKFPLRRDDLIAVVVADCTEVQLEMFDESDARTTMLGQPLIPEYQEAFQGQRVCGLYEAEHQFAQSDRFRDRVDAVLFIRSIRGNDYHPILIFQPGTPQAKRDRLVAQLLQIPEYHNLIVI